MPAAGIRQIAALIVPDDFVPPGIGSISLRSEAAPVRRLKLDHGPPIVSSDSPLNAG